MVKAGDARNNVIKYFELTEALNLIEQESKKGLLECHFHKGDCVTSPVALDYMNGLIALGYIVRPYGPYLLKISWEPITNQELTTTKLR